MRKFLSAILVFIVCQSIIFADDTYVILQKNNIAIDEESLLKYLRLYTQNGLTATVNKLVKDLGSDDYDTREKATEELVGIGSKAQEIIQKACEHKDLEISHRATNILHIISVNKTNMEAFPVRAAAIRVLGNLESMVAVPVIAEILKSDDLSRYIL